MESIQKLKKYSWNRFFVLPNTKIECKGQQIGWLLLVLVLYYLPNGKFEPKEVAEYVEYTKQRYHPFAI